MSPLGTFPVPQSGGSEVFWRETRVPGAAESIPLVGVAGAAGEGPSGTPSVGARHPAQTDARARAVHPPGQDREASRGARAASAGRAACPGAPGSTSTYLDMEVSTDREDG